LGYSLISVSPGLKAGIMFQGKCERAVWPVPAELVAKVGTVPAGSSAPLDILDRGSSATSVELVGAPWLYPILLQSKLHQGPPEPQRKAPHLLWLQPRTVVTYWGYASPRCCTWATFSWHVWFIPNSMGTWKTTHCTGHPMPSHASGSSVYKSYIYIYVYIYMYIYMCIYIYCIYIHRCIWSHDHVLPVPGALLFRVFGVFFCGRRLICARSGPSRHLQIFPRSRTFRCHERSTLINVNINVLQMS
jgi:hypothetical protein